MTSLTGADINFNTIASRETPLVKASHKMVVGKNGKKQDF